MIVAVAALLTIAVLAFVLIVRPKDVPDPVPVSPIQHLEERKQAIYDNLRELQFEYRLGKLSDDDYKQTKLSLQKELATVLADMEATIKRLGLAPTRVVAQKAKAPGGRTICPHCGAKFPQALKYCGECGRAIA